MTYSREVIAYIAAHLGGYVVSMVLTQAVLMPMLIQTEFVRNRMGMMALFFSGLRGGAGGCVLRLHRHSGAAADRLRRSRASRAKISGSSRR